MGTIQKFNWRNPFTVLALFGIAALVLSLAWNVLEAVHQDPEPPLTATQARQIIEPYRLADSIRLVRQEERDREQLQAAQRIERKADSLHQLFDNQQPLRDEKYNRALSASDAELMRQWADRYDR